MVPFFVTTSIIYYRATKTYEKVIVLQLTSTVRFFSDIFCFIISLNNSSEYTCINKDKTMTKLAMSLNYHVYICYIY